VSETLRVYVDFDNREDPIAGRLRVGDGERPFTGWLGLIAALEYAIADQRSASGIKTSSAETDVGCPG
jgi:hypothetical protein